MVTNEASNVVKLVGAMQQMGKVTSRACQDVFKGCRTKKIKAKGYDLLPGFTLGSHLDKALITELFDVLLEKEILEEYRFKNQSGYNNTYLKASNHGTQYASTET